MARETPGQKDLVPEDGSPKFKCFIGVKDFPGGSVGKEPANARDAGSAPGSGRSSGEGNSNPLQCSVWRIPWTEEPDGYIQSIGSQRVGHDCD